MTAAPFQASPTAAGLWWLAEPALPDGYGIALVPAAGQGAPPSEISFAESWTTWPGLYLMTGTRPATAQDEADLLAATRDLAAWLGPAGRFAWAPDTTGPAGRWGAAALLVSQEPGASTGTVAAVASLPFGAYAVTVSRGVAVALADDGFALTGGPSPPFSLAAPGGGVWTLAAPAAGGSALSFAGEQAGCLLLDLALAPAAAGAEDDYARLDVGMRVAVDPDRADHAAAGLLRTLSYPLFTGVPTGGVSLAGRFDAARPLDAARTRLAYAAAVAHGCHYRAPLGYTATLTPVLGGGAPLPAALAFHRRPPSRRAVPGDDPFYLGPAGPFALSVAGPSPRLACGTSGYECFAFSAADAARVTFTPGQPAYARGLVQPLAGVAPAEVGGRAAVRDGVEDEVKDEADDDAVTLDAAATCSYAAVTPAAGATVDYLAQPRGGALHRVRADAPAEQLPYLEYLAVPAGGVGTADTAPYPLLPYGGVPAVELRLRERLEQRVLGPARRQALAALGPASAQGGTGATAATPRGLLSTFGPGLESWQSIQLAAYAGQATAAVAETPHLPVGTIPPPLQLLSLGPDLRAALLSTELFLVAADAGYLLQQADLNYWVTDAAMADLRALPADQRPSDDVLSALDACRTPKPGRDAFVTMLNASLPAGWTAWQDVILQYCAYFELDVGGWRFRLSPTLWGVGADPAHPVLMVFKFAAGTLRDLALDPSSWTAPRFAWIDGSPRGAADVLRAVIEEADREAAAGTGGRPSPLDYFVARVLDDPSWNGVLVLNASVPLDDLPPELQGLAGGIDPARFRAHHVGVAVSPVTVGQGGALALDATPVFGLIDYQDPEDVAQTYDDFDFKVLLLRVLFRNSAVADFASRVELFVNRLLGSTLTLLDSEHYNNLILDGGYQRSPGGGHYVFTRSEAATFLADSPVLHSVEVTSAQFGTLASGEHVASRFLLWGRLRFHALDGFDVFSFGPSAPLPDGTAADGWLSFSGLAIDMAFEQSDPAGTRAFVVDLGTVGLDAASSVARATSLYRRFPLQVAALEHGGPKTAPRDRGYLPVRVPLYQPALNDGWHALVFTVDLGTLGALAADAGLTVTLAAAWGPGTGRPAVNVGLKLPGVQSVGQLLPLEGVLGLGFQSLEMDAADSLAGGPSYVMRLRRFYLRLLGWQFPPGQADVYLFGDPDTTRLPAGGRRGALGWYAAYQKKE